jgi:hypothetical protein
VKTTHNTGTPATTVPTKLSTGGVPPDSSSREVSTEAKKLYCEGDGQPPTISDLSYNINVVFRKRF